MLAVLPSVAPTGFDVLTQLLGKFIKHVKHEQRSRDSGHGQQIKHNQRIRKLRERERTSFCRRAEFAEKTITQHQRRQMWHPTDCLKKQNQSRSE